MAGINPAMTHRQWPRHTSRYFNAYAITAAMEVASCGIRTIGASRGMSHNVDATTIGNAAWALSQGPGDMREAPDLF